MRLRELYHVFKDTVRRLDSDDGLGLASEAAFNFAFSFFPFLLFFVSLIGLSSRNDEILDRMLQLSAEFLPPESVTLVNSYLQSLGNADLNLNISLSLALGVFAASRIFNAFIKAMMKAYDAPRKRPFWKNRLIAIGMVFLFGLLGGLAFLGMILSPLIANILRDFGLDTYYVKLVDTLRYPVTILLIAPALALLYRLGPDCDHHRAYELWPGAMIATFLWILMSYGFSAYVAGFANYNKTYGALGAVIILLTWMYLTSLVVIIGAEFNGAFGRWMRNELPSQQPDQDSAREHEAH